MKKEHRPLRRRPLFMPLVLPVAGALLLILVVILAIRMWPVTTVIVIRHAEKATEPVDDPGLSEAGRARAQILAAMLEPLDGGPGPLAIYVTDYRRSRETAAPLAERWGVAPVVYDAAESAQVVAGALAAERGGVALIVGHSNTVPELVAAVGGPRLQDLAEDRYGDLLILTVPRLGKSTFLHLRFGAEGGAP
jgi:phosphohistidine phosphatase SixA